MSSDRCTQAMSGWLAACAAATLAFYACGLIGLALASGGVSAITIALGIVGLISVGPPIFMITIILTGIPAALVIWASEQLRVRSAVFFGGSGAVTAILIENVLLQIFTPFSPTIGLSFLMAGLAAGLAYWHIAGRYAGDDPAT